MKAQNSFVSTKKPTATPSIGPIWELWGIATVGGVTCGLWALHFAYPKAAPTQAQAMLLWHSLSAGLFFLLFGYARFEMARRGPAGWGGEAAYTAALLGIGFLGAMGWIGLGLPSLGMWGLGGLLSGAIFLWLGPELAFWQDRTRHASVGMAALFGIIGLIFLWLWLEPWLIAFAPWLCLWTALAFFFWLALVPERPHRTWLFLLFLLFVSIAPWQLGFLRSTPLLVHARAITQAAWTLPHQDRFALRQLAQHTILPLEDLESIAQTLIRQRRYPHESLRLYTRVWQQLTPTQRKLRAVSIGKELAHLAASERNLWATAFVQQGALHRPLLHGWLEALLPHNATDGRESLASFLVDLSLLDAPFSRSLQHHLRLASIFHRSFRPLASEMLKALGSHSPQGREETQFLASSLFSTTAHEDRYRLLVALRGQPARHLFALRETLRPMLYQLVMKDDTNARTTALSVLYRITSFDAQRTSPPQTPWSAFSLHEIQQMIYDANAITREYAVRLLNLLEPRLSQKTEHFHVLLKEDLDDSVRMTVINEVAKLRDPSHTLSALLFEALLDPNASIRYLALYHLSQQSPPPPLFVPALQRLLKDPDPDTRSLAQTLYTQRKPR